MSRIAICCILFILVGCGNPTASTTSIPGSLPLKRDATQTPSHISPPNATYTPVVSWETAYPASIIEQTLSPDSLAYPVATVGPSPTPWPTLTPTVTLDSIENRDALRDALDQCMRDGETASAAWGKNPDLAGLQFLIGDGRWKINPDGHYSLVSCMPETSFSPTGDRISLKYENDFWILNLQTSAVQQVSDEADTVPWAWAWSPEGRYVYYNKALRKDEYEHVPGEIWAFDTQTNERWQVTNSPQIKKWSIRVWPNHPEWIVYHAITPDMEYGPGFMNAVVLVKIDGTEEQILSESGYYLFTPDGNRLVFSREGQGVIFLEPGKDPEPFRADSFKFDGWDYKGGSDPLWSPNGNLLAIGGVASNDIGEFSGIAVFNLITKNALFLHPFTPVGSEAPAFYYSWSPNNLWLAAYFRDDDFDRAGLWIIRADGTEEHHLGQSNPIAWNLENNQLLYFSAVEERQFLLLDLDTWKSKPVTLPESARVTGWD